MNSVKSSEILFLYDVENANPNGDPISNNLPRIDEETSKVYATDVFLKYHIRDYFYQNILPELDGNFDIWVRNTKEENDGVVVDAKKRYEILNVKTKEEFLQKCLDAQMFGAVVPIKNGNHITGAWQFSNITSLNEIDVVTDKGITTFSSGENKSQGTFREDHYVRYALMQSYSRINAQAAKQNKLTEDTLSRGIESMWYSIQNLNTRSKLGHNSKFIMLVEYNNNNRFIGNKLNNCIDLSLNSGVTSEKAIRNGNDYVLTMDKLSNLLISNKSIISKVKLYYSNQDPHASIFESFQIQLEDQKIEIEILNF